MELYLDSANLKEIERISSRFPRRSDDDAHLYAAGRITDIDGTIVKLSKMVPVLQIEALGNSAEEVMAEAKRQPRPGTGSQREPCLKTGFAGRCARLQNAAQCRSARECAPGVHAAAGLYGHACRRYLRLPLVGGCRTRDTMPSDWWNNVNAVNHYRYDTR